MKVLVTGSAGFIGFHLAQQLLADGHEVVGFDNFNDYYDPTLKEARHNQLIAHEHFHAVRGDLSDYGLLQSLFSTHAFDRVCHLAAQAGVRYSIEKPFAYQQSNLEGHLNVLEACRHANVSRLVYASSSSVYGGNKKIPFAESDSVDQPISLYAATKKANELMSHTYTHLYGLQTVGLRFFTVYGPWGRPDMAYWLFTKAMLADKPIKVFNQGDMQRDFTYVDDVVAGVVQALQVDGLAPYEIFNIGNNKPEHLMAFIETVAECLGVEPKMELLPMQPGDVPTTYADITAAQKKLGYKPTTSMKQGLQAFTDWYQSHADMISASCSDQSS